MNVNHLKFFLATIDEGSVTAAAERCFVTQPTLSAGLASLERELGGKLMLRSRQGVTLTPLGESVLETAREIVQRVNSLRNAATSKQSGYLRLAVATSTPAIYLQQLLDYCQQRNLSEIRVVETSAEDGAELIRCGRADVLLTTSLEKTSSLSGVLLDSDRHGLMIPPNHKLAARKFITPAQMHGENMIVRMHSEETRAATQSLRMVNSNPQVVARVTSDQYAHALVAASVGVCVISEKAFHNIETNTDVVWRPAPKTGLTRYVHLLWQDEFWKNYFDNFRVKK